MKHILGKEYEDNNCENCTKCIKLGDQVCICTSDCMLEKKDYKK